MRLESRIFHFYTTRPPIPSGEAVLFVMKMEEADYSAFLAALLAASRLLILALVVHGEDHDRDGDNEEADGNRVTPGSRRSCRFPDP